MTLHYPGKLAAVARCRKWPCLASLTGLLLLGGGGTASAEETAAKPPEPEKPPLVNPSVWIHTGAYANNHASPKKLNDVSGDAEVDILMGGKLRKNIGWQADFVASWGGGTMNGSLTILDLIAKLESDNNLINLWFGRMLVPSDRANFSGFWFAAPWYYPGFFVPGQAPIGPRQGPNGRNDGATVWGQVAGGLAKYYVGAFDLENGSTSPLITSRINISLLNPEPGYYHSSTYYGQDRLALGASFQAQKHGSAMTNTTGAVTASDDYTGYSVDLLYEKVLGGAGTIDLEGALYGFMGDYETIKSDFLVLASYLTPNPIGWGKLQPLVRLQSAKPKAGGDSWTLLDAQVAYVIDGYACRATAGYQHGDVGGLKSNTLFLGVQLQR